MKEVRREGRVLEAMIWCEGRRSSNSMFVVVEEKEREMRRVPLIPWVRGGR